MSRQVAGGAHKSVTRVFGNVVMEVDRTRSLRESLEATGRNLSVNGGVVDMVSRSGDGKVELVFFKPDDSAYDNGILSGEMIEGEYKKRGLVADPQALTDFIAQNPTSTDDTHIGCQWRDTGDNFCYATFGCWGRGRGAHVYRYNGDWRSDWLFAGVRKKSCV